MREERIHGTSFLKPLEGSASSKGRFLLINPMGGIHRPPTSIDAGFEETAGPPLSGGVFALLGVGKERARGVFYLAENYRRILGGRMIKSTLGKKWVDSVYLGGVVRKELNEGNRDGEFQGASLRYFPVEEGIVDSASTGIPGAGGPRENFLTAARLDLPGARG
jgi:hypothetical protein